MSNATKLFSAVNISEAFLMESIKFGLARVVSVRFGSIRLDSEWFHLVRFEWALFDVSWCGWIPLEFVLFDSVPSERFHFFRLGSFCVLFDSARFGPIESMFSVWLQSLRVSSDLLSKMSAWVLFGSVGQMSQRRNANF